MLSIPAADGYHYGDNPTHNWNNGSQAELVRALRRAEVKVRFYRPLIRDVRPVWLQA